MLVFGRRSRDWVLSGTFSCINNKDQTQSRTMVNPNRFYTYAYLRQDRTPYYIGKGSGIRIYDKKGRPCSKPKDKSRIIFLKQNLTEEESFKHEKYMIAVFGRKDLGTGILHNRTNGGEGASGWVPSEETKIKISESKKGENHPYYGKRGKNSVWYGKSHSEESRKKMSEVKKGKSQSEETRKKLSEIRKGKKWWNDGCGNSKRSVECPGEGWFPGMSEEQCKVKRGENNPNYGKKWWNDGKGNSKSSAESPGEGWVLGRMKKNT